MPVHVIRSLNPMLNTERESKEKHSLGDYLEKRSYLSEHPQIGSSAKDNAAKSMVLDKLLRRNRKK